MIVSEINTRDFWRGRLPPHRLVTEAWSVHRKLKTFAADAWLVYNPSRKNPDLFGWWQRPKRYVLWHADPGGGRKMPGGWRRLFGFAHRRSLLRADHVAAYHPGSADGLRPVVPADRLHIFPPATASWDCIPAREEARGRLGLPQGSPVILSVTRLTLPESGASGKTETMLNLLAVLPALAPNAQVVLVGDGPGRPLVEEEIAGHGLGARVRVVPRVEHSEMKWYFAACDVFAYPYPLDRPYLSILEAQSCGRPVVALATRSAELTVQDGCTGLLVKDLGSFAQQLPELTNDRDRCETMGRSARQYVARCHSMEVRVHQIEQLLIGSVRGQEMTGIPCSRAIEPRTDG
jgi:glycosyltransferase involved in cell wall biosynthesis